MRIKTALPNVEISQNKNSAKVYVKTKERNDLWFDCYYEDGSPYHPEVRGEINWCANGSVSVETAREFAKALLLAADYVDEMLESKVPYKEE